MCGTRVLELYHYDYSDCIATKISILLTFFSHVLFFSRFHASDTFSKGAFKKGTRFRIFTSVAFFRQAITVQRLFVSVRYCFFTRRGQASRWRGYLVLLRLPSAFYAAYEGKSGASSEPWRKCENRRVKSRQFSNSNRYNESASVKRTDPRLLRMPSRGKFAESRWIATTLLARASFLDRGEKSVIWHDNVVIIIVISSLYLRIKISLYQNVEFLINFIYI